MSGRSPGFSFHERGRSFSTSSADGDQSSISCLYRGSMAVIRMTPLPSILAFAVDEVLRPGLFVTTVVDDVTPLAVTDELNERSEERRVGKECGTRRAPEARKDNRHTMTTAKKQLS